MDLIADAVSSRTPANKDAGLKRIAAEGAKISSTEMALFEILKTAEHPNSGKSRNLSINVCHRVFFNRGLR